MSIHLRGGLGKLLTHRFQEGALGREFARQGVQLLLGEITVIGDGDRRRGLGGSVRLRPNTLSQKLQMSH
jgi:hypothetical protein